MHTVYRRILVVGVPKDCHCEALVHHPDLVLADEPTEALIHSPVTKCLIYLNLSAEHNTSLLLVNTHDKYATRICDRTFYMQDGCLST